MYDIYNKYCRQHEMGYNREVCFRIRYLNSARRTYLKLKIMNGRRLTQTEKAMLDMCHDNCVCPAENLFFKIL